MHSIAKPGCEVDITRTVTLPREDQYPFVDGKLTIVLGKADTAAGGDKEDEEEFKHPFWEKNWAISSLPCEASSIGVHSFANGIVGAEISKTLKQAFTSQIVAEDSQAFVLEGCNAFPTAVEMKISKLSNERKYSAPPPQTLNREATKYCEAATLLELKWCLNNQSTTAILNQTFTTTIRSAPMKLGASAAGPYQVFTLDFLELPIVVPTTTTTTTTKTTVKASQLRRLGDVATTAVPPTTTGAAIPTVEPKVEIVSISLKVTNCSQPWYIQKLVLNAGDGSLTLPTTTTTIATTAGTALDLGYSVTATSREALKGDLYALVSSCSNPKIDATYLLSVRKKQVSDNNVTEPPTSSPNNGTFQNFYLLAAILTSLSSLF